MALQRRHRGELTGPLGDVRDRVADPLQLGADPVEREEEAQVAGHRLLGGDRQDHVVHRLDLEGVDLLVALDDGERLRVVVRLERLHREADPLLDDAAHPEEDVLDRPLLAVEGPAGQRNDGFGDVALDPAQDLLDLAVEHRLLLGISLGHVLSPPAQPKRPET